MIPTVSPDESDESVVSAGDQPGVPQVEQTDALRMLAAVAHALDALPVDADDAALVDALGNVLVPDLADLCLLQTADATGQLHLVGIVPSSTAEAQQLLATLDEQGASMTIYEPLVDEEQPVLVAEGIPANGDDQDDALAEHLALTQLAGISWELVVPLHADGPTDALLVLDRIAAQSGSDDANGRPLMGHTDTLHLARVLASLVSRWRAGRALRQQQGTLRDQLDEAAHAGRELAHTLNNSLTMPVGVVELLLDRSSLSADLQEMVRAAAMDLAALERHIRAYQNQMRSHSSGRLTTDGSLPPP